MPTVAELTKGTPQVMDPSTVSFVATLQLVVLLREACVLDAEEKLKPVENPVEGAGTLGITVRFKTHGSAVVWHPGCKLVLLKATVGVTQSTCIGGSPSTMSGCICCGI